MKKRKIQKVPKRFITRFGFVLAMIILLFLIFGIVKEYFHRLELDRELAGLEAELASLNLDQQNFLQSLAAYESDFYLEQEARTKFNLIKSGEKVVVIPASELTLENSDESDQLNPDLENGQAVGAFGNAKAWWSYFFGVKS